jgi:predicted phosphodiesterase
VKTLNIQVASDLHLEWHADSGGAFIESLDPTDVDVLVLAGDITSARLAELTFNLICAKYPQVVYVNGNHEYYGEDPATVKRLMSRTMRLHPNLHWLHQSTATIEGVRFVGTTLWFPPPPKGIRKELYADYKHVLDYEPWVYEEHQRTLDFLRSELQPSDVLVTHFLPLEASIQPEYEGNAFNCFFYSGAEAEAVVRKASPKLVIHGHTHSSVHTKVPTFSEQCMEVVCNPFGYVRAEENPKFDEHLIVAV